MEMQEPADPRVVIIGAGFGGLEAAKHLGNKPVRVTVIDRTNYHLFQPLLFARLIGFPDPNFAFFKVGQEALFGRFRIGLSLREGGRCLLLLFGVGALAMLLFAGELLP